MQNNENKTIEERKEEIMENILEFLKTDLFILILTGTTILLFILYIINCVRLRKINKNYSKFLKKLGNGNNIEEMLKQYIDNVSSVEQRNEEVINYCRRLDNDMAKCIQKIGIVRYSAFKDTGSDLSFTLALLDVNNDGVVLNGIYSREMSNIYAKPVKNGESTYTMSEEEIEAIRRAINSFGHVIKE